MEKFVQWIGNGEVKQPNYQYPAINVDSFQLNDSFKKDDVLETCECKRPSNP